jgi:hypothetical protein
MTENQRPGEEFRVKRRDLTGPARLKFQGSVEPMQICMPLRVVRMSRCPR